MIIYLKITNLAQAILAYIKFFPLNINSILRQIQLFSQITLLIYNNALLTIELLAVFTKQIVLK